MKATIKSLIIGMLGIASVYAGEDYSSKGAKVVVPPPPAPCLWTWFAGGSAGTVESDWDEEIYTLHVGVERKCDGDKCTHAFFLEVGWTEKDSDYSAILGDFPTTLEYECEVIPITINYKYECELSNSLNWYCGVGAGVALTDCKARITRQTGNGNLSQSASEDETVFYAHIFAGIVYNVTESFELFLGARYIFMDEPDYFGSNTILGDTYEMDGNIHYEIGGRINF